MTSTPIELSYWKWLAKGSGGKPGYRRLVNKWLLLHLAVGGFLAWCVKNDLTTAANSVLLPLVGILTGLSFAWAGNAQALMQVTQFEEMADFHEGGFIEYVFVYQTAIFTILVTLVAWAFAGFGIYDQTYPTPARCCGYFAIKAVLFCFSSLTLRECWHVVLGAQWMLIIQRQLKRPAFKPKTEEKPNTEGKP